MPLGPTRGASVAPPATDLCVASTRGALRRSQLNRIRPGCPRAMSGVGLWRVAVARSSAVVVRSAVGRRRFVLAGLWVIAAAAQWGALWPAVSGEHSSAAKIALHVVGGSFAACGLLAWHRRPD